MYIVLVRVGILVFWAENTSLSRRGVVLVLVNRSNK